MKIKFLLTFLLIIFMLAAFAQNDSTIKTTDTTFKAQKIWRVYKDSATLAKEKITRDSLTFFFLKPDPQRQNLFVDEMLKKHISKDLVASILKSNLKRPKSNYETGKPVKRMSSWVIFAIFILTSVFGLIRLVFKKQTETIFQAFYDNRVLAQINKEDNIFTSWYFLFSYLAYSLIIGLFLYLYLNRYGNSSSFSDFSLFISGSLYFALLLGAKIILLRFLGFIFQMQRVVKEYINVIYLSFFNISILFIPLTIILVLTVFKENNWILIVASIIVLAIFLLQFFRVAVQILSTYKLSKFYLILYLCALEICPILIIIKALNIFNI